MSMFRRRLMMQQTQAIDYLEGYRISGTSTYRVDREWLDNETLRVYHTRRWDFMGVNTVAVNIISAREAKASTGFYNVMSNIALPIIPTFAPNKMYTLRFEVLNVSYTKQSGEDIADNQKFRIGHQTNYNIYSKKWNEIRVGDIAEYTNLGKAFTEFCVEANSSKGIKFDISLKVTVKEA